MPKNRIVKFRVSNDQYERISNNKQSKGYVTLASYLRDLALDKNFEVESRIFENNRLIKEILSILKDGTKPRK